MSCEGCAVTKIAAASLLYVMDVIKCFTQCDCVRSAMMSTKKNYLMRMKIGTDTTVKCWTMTKMTEVIDTH